jgi:hypothetical protein
VKFTFEWQVMKADPSRGIQYHHVCNIYSPDMKLYYGLITVVFADKWPESYYDQSRMQRHRTFGYRYVERIDCAEFQYDGDDSRYGLNPATGTPLWRLSRTVPDGTGAFWSRARKLAQDESARVIIAINS